MKTQKEFNEKWKDHLEKGHYGMNISNQKVLAYMDMEFERLKEKNPNFQYSQIKLKFNQARVYMNIDPSITSVYEDKINELIHG